MAVTALAGIFSADLSLMSAAIIIIIYAGVFTYYWSQLVSFAHVRSVKTIRWLADQKTVSVRLGDGQWYGVELVKQRICWPFFLAAELKLTGMERAVVVYIWRDSVPPDMFRRLKVIWRLAPGPVSAIRS